MAQLPRVSYRPFMGKAKWVQVIINQLYQKNLNHFIDEAVKDRIVRWVRSENKIEESSLNVGKVLFERRGWEVFEPGSKLNKTFHKKIKSGKAKYKQFNL